MVSPDLTAAKVVSEMNLWETGMQLCGTDSFLFCFLKQKIANEETHISKAKLRLFISE